MVRFGQRSRGSARSDRGCQCAACATSPTRDGRRAHALAIVVHEVARGLRGPVHFASSGAAHSAADSVAATIVEGYGAERVSDARAGGRRIEPMRLTAHRSTLDGSRLGLAGIQMHESILRKQRRVGRPLRLRRLFDLLPPRSVHSHRSASAVERCAEPADAAKQHDPFSSRVECGGATVTRRDIAPVTVCHAFSVERDMSPCMRCQTRRQCGADCPRPDRARVMCALSVAAGRR